MNPLDLSNVLGLVALGTIILNLSLGIGIRARIRVPMPNGLSLLKVHKATAYLASGLIILHVILIPFIPDSGFHWKDLLLPLWTKHQPWIHSLGAMSVYLITVVVVSSYFKAKMNYKVWRLLHYLSYFALPCLFVHGLLTDPALKEKAIDFLDAEKVFIEVLAILSTGLVYFRLRSMRSK